MSVLPYNGEFYVYKIFKSYQRAKARRYDYLSPIIPTRMDILFFERYCIYQPLF
jgi:hypothetical protein